MILKCSVSVYLIPSDYELHEVMAWVLLIFVSPVPEPYVSALYYWVAKSTGFGVTSICTYLASSLSTWVIYLLSLDLSFLICKIVMTIMPTSRNCCESKMGWQIWKYLAECLFRVSIQLVVALFVITWLWNEWVRTSGLKKDGGLFDEVRTQGWEEA